jgi:hypothetical protein
MLISEQEKEEILSKYYDNTSKEVENYMKRRFPISYYKFDWMAKPFIQILVVDELIVVDNNKKRLVNKIYHLISDDFTHLDENTIRRTIKMYLDVALSSKPD